MGPLKDLSAGLARFVYAWLVPSATVVAVFVLPDLKTSSRTGPRVGSLDSFGLMGIAIVILGVVFAYGALPIYRVLEGYVMPAALKRRLRRRQLRDWYRLKAKAAIGAKLGPDFGLAMERLELYPTHVDDVLPTRLGGTHSSPLKLTAMNCLDLIHRRCGMNCSLSLLRRSAATSTTRRPVSTYLSQRSSTFVC